MLRLYAEGLHVKLHRLKSLLHEHTLLAKNEGDVKSLLKSNSSCAPIQVCTTFLVVELVVDRSVDSPVDS